MVSKTKVAQQTQEQIEYEGAKKNFRIATAKARLYSEGIDQSKMSQQIIDKVMRIFDDIDRTNEDKQRKTLEVQQDTEAKIQKINRDASGKFDDMQKRYQDLVNSLKSVTTDVPQSDEHVSIGTEADPQSGADVTPQIKTEQTQEEVREKTREDKISEITDILLGVVREEIFEKANEIMCTLDKKASDIIVKSLGNEQTNVVTEEPAEIVSVEEKVVRAGEMNKTVSDEKIRKTIYKDIA